MDEHEQNGVIAPNTAASNIPQSGTSVRNQIGTQTLYREIGADDTHQYADEEQQYQDFDGVIEKEVHGHTQRVFRH